MSCIMTAIWRQTLEGARRGERRSNMGMSEERCKEEAIQRQQSVQGRRLGSPPSVTGLPQTDHLSFRFSSPRRLGRDSACPPPPSVHLPPTVSGWITRGIAQSEPPYFLFGVGPGCPEGQSREPSPGRAAGYLLHPAH